MMEDDIQKLLGGYATDALSAEERKRLFEAAVEDQKLFERLQDEDALRELLQDPVVRAQARQALESASRRRSFSWQRWAVGVVVPAMVAIAVIAVWKRPNAPAPPQPVAELKKPDAEPGAGNLGSGAGDQESKKPVKPGVKPGAKRREGTSAVAQLQAPPAPASAMFRAVAPAASSIPDEVRRQFSPQAAVGGPLYQGPLVQFTVETTGVKVKLGTTGYVAMYQLDSAGNAKHLYPENDVAMLVAAGGMIQFPSTAIQAADSSHETLRLVIVPAAQTAVNGALGGAPAAGLVESSPSPLAPLVVQVPLPAR